MVIGKPNTIPEEKEIFNNQIDANRLTIQDIISRLNEKAEVIIERDITYHSKNSFIEQEFVRMFVNDRIDNTIFSGQDLFAITNDIIRQVSLILEKKPNSEAQGIVHAFIFEKVYGKGLNISELNNLFNKKYIINTNEYSIAKKICLRIQCEYNCQFDKIEVKFLAFILSSFWSSDLNNLIQIVVLCHGDTIASNMMHVAKSLMDGDNIYAIDMPLDVPPNKIIAVLEEHIKSLSSSKGILILADMGSLCSFGTIMEHKLNKRIRTIGMVSTPIVIEALRLSSFPNEDLDSIYFALQLFKGYKSSVIECDVEDSKSNAIVIIKSPRDLMSYRVNDFISDILKELDFSCEVMELRLDELENAKRIINSKYNVLFSTGLSSPDTGWDFISFQDLFSLQGEELIFSKCGLESKLLNKSHSYSITLQKLAESYLQEYLTVLNPKAIVATTLQFIDLLNSKRNLNCSHSKALRACIHICIALDRTLKNDTIQFYQQDSDISDTLFDEYATYSETMFGPLGLSLHSDELSYVIEMMEAGNSS